MNMRSIETLVALVSETPMVAFWIAPPVHVAADVQVPPLPVTVKGPVAALKLFQTIPFAAPFVEMDLKVNVPSELVRLTAVELPVDMVSPLTVRPETPLADSVPER